MPQTIDLIRHGQSTFNAHYAIHGTDPMLFDARLTALGESQARELHQRFSQEKYDLVVASPLTRAIQTAERAFGDSHGKPLKVEVWHRERVESSCDVGRPASIMAAEFPHLDFEHLDEHWWAEGADDLGGGLWHEPVEHCIKRVERFRKWLKERPEERIAVFGHATFFFHASGVEMKNCEVVRWKP